MILIRYLWVVGVGVWVFNLVAVLIPAARWGGDLPLAPAIGLAVLGLLLIGTSLLTYLHGLNRRTNGMVMGIARIFGAGYFGYKVVTGIRRG